MNACKDAGAQLGWRVMEEGRNYISCKDVSPQITSFTWAAKVDVHLHPQQKETAIVLEGTIFGLGSIQSGHLRGQVGKLRNLIEQSAKRVDQESHHSTASSIAAEIEHLAELHSKGVLSNDEFTAAKAKFLEK